MYRIGRREGASKGIRQLVGGVKAGEQEQVKISMQEMKIATDKSGRKV